MKSKELYGSGHDAKVGEVILLQARVLKKVEANHYAQVQILDGICGMNTVALTVHNGAIVRHRNMKPKRTRTAKETRNAD